MDAYREVRDTLSTIASLLIFAIGAGLVIGLAAAVAHAIYRTLT